MRVSHVAEITKLKEQIGILENLCSLPVSRRVRRPNKYNKCSPAQAKQAFSRIAEREKQGVGEEPLQHMNLVVKRHEMAWKAFQAGHSKAEIRRAIGHHVEAWFQGKLPNALLRRDPAFRDMSRMMLQVPQGPCLDFSFFLGVFCANAEVARHGKSFTILQHDPQLIHHVAKLSSAWLTGGEARVQRGSRTNWSSWSFGGEEVRRELERLTAHNTHLPWEYLLTQREQEAFLSGFLSFARGTLLEKESSYVLVRVRGQSLLGEVACIMRRLGIFPRFVETPHAAIILRDTNEFRQVLARGLIKDSKLAERWKSLAEKPKQRREIPYRVYEEYRLRKDRGEFQEMRAYQIAKSLSLRSEWPLSRETVLRWQVGLPPLSAKRHESLLALEDNLGIREQAKHALHKRIQQTCKTPQEILHLLEDFEGGRTGLQMCTGIPELELAKAMQGRAELQKGSKNRIFELYGVEIE